MKKPLVLVAVFLALLAYVYFYEIRGEEERTRARELEESLLRLGEPEEEVTSLLLSRPGLPDISLARQDEGWVLRQPLEVDADQGAVQELLAALGSASRVRSLPDGGDRPGEYGLNPPRLRLQLVAVGGERVLLLGSDGFAGSNLYVQFEGEKEVLLTERRLWTAADKDLLGWRSRKVLRFDRDQVTAVELEGPQGSIRLARREQDWFLEAPLQEEADPNAVQGLLSALDLGEVQEFVAEEPEGLEDFGLEKPARTLRLALGSEGSWKSLQLGNPSGEHYLARDPARPAVFKVEKKIFDQLASPVWTFRDKDVVNVEQDRIAELRIRRAEGREEILLSYQDYTWTVLEPASHRDQEALSYKFWYPINDIRFQSIDDPDHPPFPEPDVQIEVRLLDGSTRSFEFVGQGGSYRARRVDSDRQGTISGDDFQKLQFEVEEIL